MLTQISHSSPLWRVNVVAVAIAFYNVTVFIVNNMFGFAE